MTGLRLSPRTRRFLLWTARVAFLAYLIQIMAVDHWHRHPANVFGVEGTSAHVAHCHGGGDCSDGAVASSPGLADNAILPMPSSTLTVKAMDGDGTPEAAYAETLLQPPRAA
jgi:hypothetical protein